MGVSKKEWYPQIIHLFIEFSMIIFTIHFGGKFFPLFLETNIQNGALIIKLSTFLGEVDALGAYAPSQGWAPSPPMRLKRPLGNLLC